MFFFSLKDCVEQEWSNGDLMGHGHASKEINIKDECIQWCITNNCKFWMWGYYPPHGLNYCWLKTSDAGKISGDYDYGTVCAAGMYYI